MGFLAGGIHLLVLAPTLDRVEGGEDARRSARAGTASNCQAQRHPVLPCRGPSRPLADGRETRRRRGASPGPVRIVDGRKVTELFRLFGRSSGSFARRASVSPCSSGPKTGDALVA